MKSQLMAVLAVFAALLVVACVPAGDTTVVDTGSDGPELVDDQANARDPVVNVYEDNPDTVVVKDTNPDTVVVKETTPSTIVVNDDTPDTVNYYEEDDSEPVVNNYYAEEDDTQPVVNNYYQRETVVVNEGNNTTR